MANAYNNPYNNYYGYNGNYGYNGTPVPPPIYGYQNNNQNQSNEMIVVGVQGEEGVKQYPVAAGLSVLLMDYNAKKFWIKTNSSNGLNISIEEYTFEKVQNEEKDNRSDNYVTKEEFKELKDSMSDVKKMLDDLTK